MQRNEEIVGRRREKIQKRKRKNYTLPMDYYGIILHSSSLPKTSLSLLFFFFLFLSIKTTESAAADTEAFSLTTIPFTQIYSPLFSEFNIHKSPDDQSVHLLLNRHSGTPSDPLSLNIFFINSYNRFKYIYMKSDLYIVNVK